MAHSTFGQRLGYAFWLYHLKHGRVPTKKALATAVDRTGPVIAPWLGAAEPPPDWKVHEPLARFFDVPQEWLIQERGQPPLQPFWDAWIGARRAESTRLDDGLGRRLTAPELDRAHRKSEREKSEQSAKPAKVLSRHRGAR